MRRSKREVRRCTPHPSGASSLVAHKLCLPSPLRGEGTRRLVHLAVAIVGRLPVSATATVEQYSDLPSARTEIYVTLINITCYVTQFSSSVNRS